jgi:hypothetical protein
MYTVDLYWFFESPQRIFPYIWNHNTNIHARRSRLWYNDQICKFCFLFCGIYKGVPDVNWNNSIIKQTMSIFHKTIFKHIFHKRKSLYMLPKGKFICMLKRKFCVASFWFLAIVICFCFRVFLPLYTSIESTFICKSFHFFPLRSE